MGLIGLHDYLYLNRAHLPGTHEWRSYFTHTLWVDVFSTLIYRLLPVNSSFCHNFQTTKSVDWVTSGQSQCYQDPIPWTPQIWCTKVNRNRPWPIYCDINDNWTNWPHSNSHLAEHFTSSAKLKLNPGWFLHTVFFFATGDSVRLDWSKTRSIVSVLSRLIQVLPAWRANHSITIQYLLQYVAIFKCENHLSLRIKRILWGKTILFYFCQTGSNVSTRQTWSWAFKTEAKTQSVYFKLLQFIT